MYNFETRSAVELLNRQIKENKTALLKSIEKPMVSAEKMIDIQCKIASHFVGWWVSGMFLRQYKYKDLHSLLFAAFNKNILLSFSVLKLNSSGMYGPARPLIRNIFEWLMISKFGSISDNPSIIEKWMNEETIYFSNSVLKKIKIPSPKPFYDFWNIICEFSHATRSNMQVFFCIDDEYGKNQVLGNLAIINTLLECNYHLLNTHLITSEFEYMGRFYYNRRWSPPIKNMPTKYKVPDLRKAAHSIFKGNRSFLGPESKKLITAYKRKWVLNV